MSEIHHKSATDLSDLLARKEISAREVTEAALRRIEAIDPLHALLTVTSEYALERSARIDDARIRGNRLGPLAGIPFALKDNICTRGIQTTCGSRILDGFRPPYDATVVLRLAAADAVLIGKTNCDEFAMGSSTEYSGFGPTRNPWDAQRVPGGSSGGSAVAVATGAAAIALGSDTGGSIRQPAALCGVVGLKPTYGRVSRYGLVAYASSLDQIGPLTRTVEDAALVLNSIAGHDPRDSTSIDRSVPDFRAACRADVKGLRIGVPRQYFG